MPLGKLKKRNCHCREDSSRDESVASVGPCPEPRGISVHALAGRWEGRCARRGRCLKQLAKVRLRDAPTPHKSASRVMDRCIRPSPWDSARSRRVEISFSPWTRGACAFVRSNARFDRITYDPNRMNGQPCIRDLRIRSDEFPKSISVRSGTSPVAWPHRSVNDVARRRHVAVKDGSTLRWSAPGSSQGLR
jgi:hypothetical protein